MNKFKRMIGKIEGALAAVSFAEEGEFNTAAEMMKEERRVLLAVRERRIDGKTFKYAMNTSKRVKADLDILYISPSDAPDPALERFLAELRDEGIAYRLVRKGGCLKQAIIDYTNSKREILFVVIESSDSLDVDCAGKDKGLSESWQNLKCPLVVVSEAAKA
jgi:hypothetical protein